jgi:hypothetical protein
LLTIFAEILWDMLWAVGLHMRVRICLSVLVLLLFGTGSLAQSGYFPLGALSHRPWNDEFRATWYTEQLKALDEPSLWSLSETQKEQSYRFLWLRSFHHPVAIRVDVQADGTSRLTTKMGSGAGGYKPGHLVQNDSSVLTKKQTDLFLGRIEEYTFWKLAAEDEPQGGTDGAQWIIEGAKGGKYHVVDRWSPRDGPVRALGLLMLQDLAKLKIPNKEMY